LISSAAFAALPPDVRKGFAFPSIPNLVAARLSLAADLREASPVRHSLTAHQAAKPQERGDYDYNYQALVEHY
jgi:hypothetical protein